MDRRRKTHSRGRNTCKLLGAAICALAALLAAPAFAAKSSGCDGGGFTVLGKSGATDTDLPAASIGAGRFHVQGKYVQFDVDPASFAILDYAFLPTTNPSDMTGGLFTPVWASKTPDLQGATLNSMVSVFISAETLELTRSGPGVTVKLQALDCATGGIFQMEVERADAKATVFTHILANGAGNRTPFYFDNPNFRAREGDVVPFKDTTVTVAARVNLANDFSAKFVARDSPQAATRINELSCSNPITTRTGATVIVQHCGGQSKWLVQSGGRLGFVTGEDGVEVAPPSTTCTHQCQARDRVRGQAVVLGFPFPVPPAVRFVPRLPTP